MNTRALLPTAFTLLMAPAFAQFPVVGSSDHTLLALQTLRTAGLKLMDRPYVSDTVLTIYNLDMSLYASIPVPTLPPGFSNYGVGYISEDLFDTDPSTIEFLIYAAYSIPFHNEFWVYRADGTLLFHNDYVWFSGVGYTLNATLGIIFNTPSGALMVLDTAAAGMVYQLPGMLPCLDCNGEIDTQIGGGGQQYGTGNPYLFTFPNPTSESIEVQYLLPVGVTHADLVFFDTDGREVKRVPVNNSSDHITLSTATLAAGTYLYQLHTAAGMVPGSKVVVVK